MKIIKPCNGEFLFLKRSNHRKAASYNGIWGNKKESQRSVCAQLIGLMLLIGFCLIKPLNAEAHAQKAEQSTVAESVFHNERFDFSLPAQTVAISLNAIANQTGAQFLFPYELADSRPGNPLEGRFTVYQAVTRLLAGTDLVCGFDNGVLVISLQGESGGFHDQNNQGIKQMQIQSNSKKQLLAAVVSFFAGSQGGLAQEAGGDAIAWALEEVVVTATKRSKDLQDVAFGLSATTEEGLKRIGAIGAEDYLATMPGVTYNSLGRGRSPIIFRGVATTSTSILSEAQATSALYIDDLPSMQRWGAWTNTDPITFDVERVEALRGPQGTLFGSGALGGAVRVINNQPDASGFASAIELDAATIEGGDNSYGVNGMVNIPLIEDELALRLVAFAREDGGYIDNIRRNEDNVNSGETEGGRVMLNWAAIEQLDLRLTATYQGDQVDDTSAVFADSNDGGSYEYNGVSPEFSDVDITIYNFGFDYDFGPVELTSSSTYSERNSFINLDLASYLDFIEFGTGFDPDAHNYSLDEEIETYAQELRLSSTDSEQLEWVLGVFYFKQDISSFQYWTADELDPAFGTGNLLANTRFMPEIEEKAVFGEATYNINDRLSFTVGGRWFDGSFSTERSVLLPVGLVDKGLEFPRTETSDSSFTPKISLSYHLEEDIHLYATAAEGYRSGQINTGSLGAAGAVPESFGPDSLWNYEVGMKSLLADGRLKFNLAAFYIDWTDIQLGATIRVDDRTFNYTDNAGDATSQGVELEINYVPTENWEIGTAMTYTDAELDSVLPQAEAAGITAGSQLPGTPDYSVANYLQYSQVEVFDNIAGYIRLDHRYVGEMVTNIKNDDLNTSDDYNVFNIRAGLTMDQYELVLYVNNIADDDALTGAYFDPAGDLFNAYNVRGYRLQPRTVGLTWRASF